MIRSRARELAFKNIYQHLISLDESSKIIGMYQHDDLFLIELTKGTIEHKKELFTDAVSGDIANSIHSIFKNITHTNKNIDMSLTIYSFSYLHP
jgi:transcription termination factor NusB